ncbi:HAD hydrolase-like protein [Sphingomonas sp.]|uniref:HAD hydrolase-like protein n=1 Tax=Sphingomonas sp. TaxID=28214 RepID=UPI0018001C18|nr:HAD hydrolase-like protein [Sphingomonas sp.]MBA4762763.1 HAD hydrolase-like protein [Sphingomonas sp.]
MPETAQPLRLVIFDFDGTLSDSGNWFLSIVDHLSDRYGFRKVAPDEIEPLRKMTSRDVISHLRIPRWKLPFIARYVRKLFGRNTDKVHLFAGVTEMLAAIEAMGIPLALVTSNSEANARAVLGPENAARFSWWACGASLFGKAPKFRSVLRQSGVPVAQIVSLGDETRDIDAARAVGIRAGAVLWGYAEPEAFAHLNPDLAFSTPDQVVAFVRASAQMDRQP